MLRRLYEPGDHGRVVPADPTRGDSEDYRSDWRRDYARLIHSPAFRRLQGKKQLFPGNESDFFRNRLTHSLEVAQIAKSIATRINATFDYFHGDPIDTDLVEVAALAHDLGHPPFGHNGEEALDEQMRDAGGFEGNAQTLRIIGRLEKKETRLTGSYKAPTHNRIDCRAGLNFTYRTLASVLKYDVEIERQAKTRPVGHENRPIKGYYYTERALVEAIRQNVGAEPNCRFRTVECAIMDLADDIAYSTYDLEDAFKARFLTPMSMLSASHEIFVRVAKTINERLSKNYPEIIADERDMMGEDVQQLLLQLFSQLFDIDGDISEGRPSKIQEEAGVHLAAAAMSATTLSERIATSGYYRTRLTSDLVGRFVAGIEVRHNGVAPALTDVRLNVDVFKLVEVLKNFTYEALIESPMLKLSEHRGKEIVRGIFHALKTGDGHKFLPDDYRHMYDNLGEPDEKLRVICDFVAGMTDRYAIQFYGRLYGASPDSIYSPL